MTRISPRESAGFNMLDASIDPSAAPAPTMVCISSINRMIFPSERSTSRITAFKRSSNSPRYFVPAISNPRSSCTNSLPRNDSETSPEAIFCASPSATAVLPTPASPISIGLFLVLLLKICMTRVISESRPITGSSLFSLARSVRDLEKRESALGFLGSSTSRIFPSLISERTRASAALSMRKRASTSEAGPGCSISPKSRCSGETNWSLKDAAMRGDASKTRTNSGVRYNWNEGDTAVFPPEVPSISSNTESDRWATSIFTCSSIGTTIDSSCNRSAARRWRVDT